MTSLNQSGDTNFTVFIRLPFPRGDFVDPPPASVFPANLHKTATDWARLSGTQRRTRRSGTYYRGPLKVMI